MSGDNSRGTFLIRDSEHNPNGYSLSVKDWEESRGYHVKHYKIKPLDKGGFYIATSHTFPTLQSLVTAYSSKFIVLHFIIIRAYVKAIIIMKNLHRKRFRFMSRFGEAML